MKIKINQSWLLINYV